MCVVDQLIIVSTPSAHHANRTLSVSPITDMACNGGAALSPVTPRFRRAMSHGSSSSVPDTDLTVGTSCTDELPPMPSIVMTPLVGGYVPETTTIDDELFVKVTSRAPWLKHVLGGHAYVKCKTVSDIKTAVQAHRSHKRNRAGIVLDSHGDPITKSFEITIEGKCVLVGSHWSPLCLKADQDTLLWFITKLRDDITNNNFVVDAAELSWRGSPCAIDMHSHYFDDLKVGGVHFQKSRMCFMVKKTSVATAHKLPKEFRCRIAKLKMDTDKEIEVQRCNAEWFRDNGTVKAAGADSDDE